MGSQFLPKGAGQQSLQMVQQGEEATTLEKQDSDIKANIAMYQKEITKCVLADATQESIRRKSQLKNKLEHLRQELEMTKDATEAAK